ncbi:acyltransferase [Candidatus Pelagibacter sp.]|nr:acyltransferase [Candidatus Pelagibacter sp.]
MKLSYRPEIDGLRAVAVLSAIFYHAQISILGIEPFKGGYIGVDIFFVISGYLITSLMLKELEANKNFSFLGFYERRCRRILPVLFFIILVFLPFSWFYLIPPAFEDFSRSILYAVGFGSNFFFHYSGLEYAGVAGMYKPFLHTWSLSVEEQYYIIFPIFLYFTFKYFNKYLFQILALVLVISFLFAEWGSKNYISATFYFIHSRMWELLAGSMLAYLEIKKGSRSENKVLNELLPILGILFIVFYIVSYDDQNVAPSLRTLIPIVGTCLFIWFSKKETLLGKVMSLKLLVGIGLISYSLYLWHYPIFSFSRIIEFTQGEISKKLLLICFTIILSIITYFLIESPFRNKKKIKTKLFFSIIIFAGILIVTFNLLVVSKDGFKSRMPDVILNAVLTKKMAEEVKGNPKIWWRLKQDNKMCWNRIARGEKLCSFYEQNEKKIYLIGDSHFGTLMYDLNNKLSNRNYNFRPITARSFFYFSESLKLHSNGKLIEEYYTRLRERINKIVSESKNNIFIFGGASATYIFDKRFYVNNEVLGDPIVNYVNKDNKKFSSESLMNEFREQVENISKNNKVILVYPTPEIGFNLQYTLLKGRNWKLMQKNPTLIRHPYKEYMAINKEVFEFFDTLKNKNIHRVYPHKLFCNTKVKDQCLLHNEKDIFFSDEYHLSIVGAEMVNELLIEKIDNLYD